MDIRLDIQERNSEVDSFNIYRQEWTIDPLNLGTPFATISGTESSYTDTTAVLGEVYHYVIEAVKGTNRRPGAEIIVAALPHFGPGSQELLCGNHRNGYFGPHAASEIFDPTVLMYDLGYNREPDIAPTVWHKFIWDGKICFYPNGIFVGINGDKNEAMPYHLYQKGVFLDVETDGYLTHQTQYHGDNGVVQGRKESYNGTEFKVRTLKYVNDDPDYEHMLEADYSTQYASEWRRLLETLCGTTDYDTDIGHSRYDKFRTHQYDTLTVGLGVSGYTHDQSKPGSTNDNYKRYHRMDILMGYTDTNWGTSTSWCNSNYTAMVKQTAYSESSNNRDYDYVGGNHSLSSQQQHPYYDCVWRPVLEVVF